MAYTYTLIPGGYEIALDGALQIRQEFYPDGDPATLISDADRDALALAHIDALIAGNTPAPEPEPAP